jgi:hypothetical protein
MEISADKFISKKEAPLNLPLSHPASSIFSGRRRKAELLLFGRFIINL